MKKAVQDGLFRFGGLCRIRTYDRRIKSPQLYQLS